MNLSTIGLLLLAIAQIAVPLQMILQQETVLKKGALFRFKTEPIDPVDPLQGRYVWLSIQENYVALSPEATAEIDYRSLGYASISVDKDGFARFDSWSEERPDKTSNYIRTKALGDAYEWITTADEERKRSHKGMYIDIPFDRFYMDEKKAPRAERIARDASLENNCWVEVRIFNGKAVIEDVLIEGESLRDLANTVE